MKKIFALMLMLILCIGLCACGGETGEPIKDGDGGAGTNCEFVVDGWGHGESISTIVNGQSYGYGNGYDINVENHYLYIQLSYYNSSGETLSSFAVQAENPIDLTGTLKMKGNEYPVCNFYVPEESDASGSPIETYICFEIPVEEWDATADKTLVFSIDGGATYEYIFENNPVKPEVGMTSEEAKNTKWGEPISIEKKLSGGTAIEIWDYDTVNVSVRDDKVVYVNYNPNW